MGRRMATTDVFAAIADPTRRAILRQLGAGELPVLRLASHFDMTLSAISQHMRVLREVGLVEVRKDGRERMYRLNAEPLRTVAEWTRFYEPFWSDKLGGLGDYLNRTAGLESTPQ